MPVVDTATLDFMRDTDYGSNNGSRRKRETKTGRHCSDSRKDYLQKTEFIPATYILDLMQRRKWVK